jgi:Bacteriophage probable baseplate hub protein
MTVVPVVPAVRAPGLPERYYAPDFVVEIGGEKFDQASKGDVLELKVAMGLNEATSVDLKLNNFDDREFDLRWTDDQQLRLGSQVHVQMGYAEQMVSMMRGYITTITPDFPSDGAPTITLRALDAFVLLMESKPPQGEVTYKDKADWQIAQQIAQRHRIRIAVTESGPTHPLVVQKNDDASFIQERAKLIDFRAFVRTDPKTGEDVLHFVTPSDGRGAEPLRTYVLSWGSLRSTDTEPSLLEFKPNLAAKAQVQQVTVRGWDPVAKKKISQTATADNTPGIPRVDESSGPETAKTIGGAEGRKEVLVDRPVHTDEEAFKLAQSILANRASRFLTAHGKLIGLPDLRPDDNVEIHGVGERFGGRYHVEKVGHVLNQQGYLTEFDARKA